MKNGLILSAAVAALAGCASNAPMTNEKSLSLGKPAAQANKVELTAGQQALPEKQAMAKAGEMKPVLVMQDGVGTAQAAYISGKQALGNGKLEAAQANFEKARQLDPKMVDAFVGLGAVFSLSGRHDRAVVAFEKAVSLEPGNANWHSNLGMAHARSGAFVQAQQSLAKAWSLDPDNSRIEAQLTSVTSVAKANGLATPVAAPAPAEVKAPQVAASPLQKVGERMFTLSLGGSAPALSGSADLSAVESTNSAPLVTAPAETDSKPPVAKAVVAKANIAKADVAVSAPSLPALKIARANLAARAAKFESATDEKAPAVKKDVMPAKLVVAPRTDSETKDKMQPVVTKKAAQKPMAKSPATAVVAVEEPAMPVKTPEVQKPAIEKAPAPMAKPAAKEKAVSEPVVQKTAKPVTRSASEKAVAKMVVTKKVVARKPAVKKPAVKKPVMVRSVRGMVIVAANSTIASKVSTHLALNGLRAEKVAKPSKGLVPLTEIHYRTGYEADVAAVTKALPVRAYPIELSGLPAGVNIKVVVGSDMKRAKL